MTLAKLTTLKTERLQLQQLDLSCLTEYLEMLADPEGRRLTATTQEFSEPQIRDWLQSRATTPDRYDWAIYLNGDFCGEVVLNEYDSTNRSMNLRIALRGPNWFDRGIGTEAMAAVLEFGFREAGLNLIHLEVLTDNPRAQRVYQRLGFQPSAEPHTEDGQMFQKMELTATDWLESLRSAKQ